MPLGDQGWDKDRIWAVLASQHERLSNMERWRERWENRSFKLIMVIIGGITSLVITVVGAIILIGLGVGV